MNLKDRCITEDNEQCLIHVLFCEIKTALMTPPHKGFKTTPCSVLEEAVSCPQEVLYNSAIISKMSHSSEWLTHQLNRPRSLNSAEPVRYSYDLGPSPSVSTSNAQRLFGFRFPTNNESTENVQLMPKKMSHTQLLEIDDPNSRRNFHVSRCSVNVRPSPAVNNPLRNPPFDVFRTANRNRAFMNERLSSPTPKFPRFSDQSLNSERRYYHLRNTNQDNLPGTSSVGNLCNVEMPVVTQNKAIEIILDVHEYKPEELKVKVVNNLIIIEGKHDERMDELGLISQQFTRRFEIPQELDKGRISCTISSDGILSISGPKENKAEREIPIISIAEAAKGSSSNNDEGQSVKKKMPKYPVKEGERSVSPQTEEDENVPLRDEEEHVPQGEEQVIVPQVEERVIVLEQNN